jgi:hypothetical protein
MKHLIKLRTFCGAFALVVAGSAFASSPTPDASISFANHGGIYNWQADRDQGLWVQDVHRHWYYAKLMGPCFGLNFANSIGFDTHPMGTFDKFSAIVVPREGRCMVQSLTPSGGPREKDKAPAEQG